MSVARSHACHGTSDGGRLHPGLCQRGADLCTAEGRRERRDRGTTSSASGWQSERSIAQHHHADRIGVPTIATPASARSCTPTSEPSSQNTEDLARADATRCRNVPKYIGNGIPQVPCVRRVMLAIANTPSIRVRASAQNDGSGRALVMRWVSQNAESERLDAPAKTAPEVPVDGTRETPRRPSARRGSAEIATAPF